MEPAWCLVERRKQVVRGVKEGTYKCCIQPPPMEGGVRPPQVVPPRYQRFDTSKLEFTVQPSPNEFTIEVDRGGH